jgi:2-keto-3-deoxy-L-rhamnonate aldolase RhmA
MIKRILDTGPDGIILPLVNTKEEAEYAVRAAKYPPVGERGAGLTRAQAYGMQMAEYYQSANDNVLTILMIEHIKAVENIDEILSVDGIDAVMIGALDLSGSMGMLGQTDHPEVEAAVQKVLKAAQNANIPCGNIAVTADQANQRIEQGFKFLIIGLDIVYLLGASSESISKINRGN